MILWPWPANEGRGILLLLGSLLMATAGIPDLVAACIVQENPVQPAQVLILRRQESVLPLSPAWRIGRGPDGSKNEHVHPFVWIEHIDQEGHHEHRDAPAIQERLARHYGESGPDIIIPMGDEAAEIALSLRADLFPTARILFCSVSRAFLIRLYSESKAQDPLRGSEDFDPVALLSQLFPDTRSVVIASDIGEEKLAMQSRILSRFQADRNTKGLEVVCWIGIGSDFYQRVAELPEGTVLVYLFQRRDVDLLRDQESFRLFEGLGAWANAPVLLVDPATKTTLVGGNLGGRSRHATPSTADETRSETAPKVVVSGSQDDPNADYRALAEAKIKEMDLPPGSVIEFRIPTVWERFRFYIVAAIASLILQAITIVGLVVSRYRRLRIENALKESQAEIKNLAGRLMASQEEELKTLARELHDDFSQQLAVNAMNLGMIEQSVEKSTGKQLASVRDRLTGLSEDMHRLSRQLHPSILSDLGLEDALRSECHYLKGLYHSSMEFSVQSTGATPGVPAEIQLCMFRVAQEALRNAAKHSGADHVEVTIDYSQQVINLVVRDNGTGIHLEKTSDQPRLGFSSMRERLLVFGGELSIESEPSEGTTVSAKVSIPLKNSDGNEKST